MFPRVVAANVTGIRELVTEPRGYAIAVPALTSVTAKPSDRSSHSFYVTAYWIFRLAMARTASNVDVIQKRVTILISWSPKN